MKVNFCLLCTVQSEANPEAENQLAGAESQQNEVRVQYTEPDNPAEQAYSDQDGAASGGEHAASHMSLHKYPPPTPQNEITMKEDRKKIGGECVSVITVL